MDKKEVFHKIFEAKTNTFLVVLGKLFATKLFKEYPKVYFPDARFSEDKYVTHRLFMKSNHVVYIHDTKYAWIRHDNSITAGNEEVIGTHHHFYGHLYRLIDYLLTNDETYRELALDNYYFILCQEKEYMEKLNKQSTREYENILFRLSILEKKIKI